MTSLERARRAVEQWDYHWAMSMASNTLLANIKREIEGARNEAYKRAAQVAYSYEAPDPDGSWRESIGAAIRALKSEAS